MSTLHDPGVAAATAPVAAAPAELLDRRRQWFRSFPEGPLEFVAAVRVIWVLGLFALPMIGGTLHGYAMVGLALLLLADSVLVVWWLSELAVDREALLFARPADLRRNPWAATAAAALGQAMLLAFLLSFSRQRIPVVGAIDGMGRWVVLAVAAVAAALTMRQCRTAGLQGRPSSVLLIVPLVNWWVTRRLAYDLTRSYSTEIVRHGRHPAGPSRAAGVFADALWIMTLLMVAVALGSGSTWSSPTAMGVCSSLVLAAASVADVAAMESAQAAVLQFLRTSGPRRP